MQTLGDKSHLDFKSSQVDMKMNSLPHQDDLALHSTGPALGLTFLVCVGVVGGDNKANEVTPSGYLGSALFCLGLTLSSSNLSLNVSLPNCDL